MRSKVNQLIATMIIIVVLSIAGIARAEEISTNTLQQSALITLWTHMIQFPTYILPMVIHTLEPTTAAKNGALVGFLGFHVVNHFLQLEPYEKFEGVPHFMKAHKKTKSEKEKEVAEWENF